MNHSLRLILALTFTATAAVATAPPQPSITSITPDSGPVAGGTTVTIRGSGFFINSCPVVDPASCMDQAVYFGVARAPIVQILDDTRIVVTSPAHLPSTADVRVVNQGWTLTQKQAFTFAGDPATAFLRVLAPVLLPPIPGQFGSHFITEFRAQRNDILPFDSTPFLYLFGIASCDCPLTLNLIDDPLAVFGQGDLGGLVPSTKMNGAPGRILFLPATSAAKVSMNLRVYDTSRVAATLGTEIPIVSDSAFRSKPFVFLGVPADVRYRNTLRIYTPDPGVAPMVRVTVERSSQIVTLRPGRDIFDPGYFEMTLAPRFQSGSSVNTIPVTIEPLTAGARLWAFISSTNNDTQQITAITPNP